jgi:hypothetical protein
MKAAHTDPGGAAAASWYHGTCVTTEHRGLDVSTTIPWAVVVLVWAGCNTQLRHENRKCGENYIWCDVCVFYEITQQRLFVFLAVL